MTPKSSTHIIQGIKKDITKSKLSTEFAYDAQNIRITEGDDGTLFSITNEKGNKEVYTIKDIKHFLGNCILNNTIIIFYINTNNEDVILKITGPYNDTTKSFEENEILYKGRLNFNKEHKIQSLGVYENENIQKVYWVDGINQPRVINIKGDKSKFSDSFFDFVPELKLEETVEVEAINSSSLFAPGVIQYAFSYYNKYGQESNIFNTTPLCYLSFNNRGASPEEIIRDRAFKIKVNNLDTNFDYIRIYSIHRTSLNAVPTVKRVIDLSIDKNIINYVKKEKLSSYNLSVVNNLYFKNKSLTSINTNDKYHGKLVTSVIAPTKVSDTVTRYVFDDVNLLDFDLVIGNPPIEDGEDWNIQTLITSNGMPTLVLEQINYSSKYKSYVLKVNEDKSNKYYINTTTYIDPIYPSVSFIDNGTLGETIDPTQLLYIGGEDIIAGTITQKDNTLFLGNIELKKLSIPEEIKERIKEKSVFPYRRTEELNTEKEILYSHELDTINKYSYYKAGEHYRLGIQFQHKSGRWSEPVFISDFTQGIQMRPSLIEDTLYLPSLTYTISANLKNYLHYLGFKKMRGLVVFPESYERKVIAQGMLCPTVFNPEDRKKNNPYSQASWFLRPFIFDTNEKGLPISINDNYFINNNGNSLEYEDNLKEINKGAVIEFRHRKPLITGANRGSEIQNNTEYLVDQSVLNFYSPDINDDFVSNNLDRNIQMRIVGLINFTSNYGDIDIQTKTPPSSITAKGFVHKTISNLSSGKSGLISGLYYSDDLLYMIHPWHRSGSLNDDNASSASSNNKTQSAVLEKKKISNIKFSKYNTWIQYDKIWNSFGGNSKTSLANGISKIEYFNSNQVSLLKLKSNIEKESLNYFGNIDTLVSNENNYPIYYGTAWADNNLLESEVKGTESVRIKYKTTPHLVFKLNNAVSGHEVVLPTINNLNSVNGNQIEITEEFNPEYIGEEVKYRTFADTLSTDFPSDAEGGDLWLKEEKVWYNYYPDTPPDNAEVNSPFTILRLLKYNGESWEEHTKGFDKDKKNKVHYVENPYEASLYYFNGRVEVGESDGNNNYDYAFTWKFEKTINITPPSIENITVTQDSIEATVEYPYLYLAELYVDSDYSQNAFGGNTEEAIKNNLWLPASQSVPINSDSITYEYGDTRYQRYDCLKTYAFTPEDENQVIEIASFMCETRVNMLGRYDKNIGNLSNLNADPTNFNLFNPVYSQKDNFFNYRILDSDMYKLDNFHNTITWSKEKFVGEDVDTWTNVTMASTLDLDGTKGKINKLISSKDKLLAFQDRGISQILFNSRVQIPVSDGVPIEITNGKKVDGYVTITDNIGCSNKESIVSTSEGVYFYDNLNSELYLLGDSLRGLGNELGMHSWFKNTKTPYKHLYYDNINSDLYIDVKDTALGYSNKINAFTSFYSYNNIDSMFNLDSDLYSIKNGKIWKHFSGDYNNFYGEYNPYSVTIIENAEPFKDKVFNTLEFRADLSIDGDYLNTNNSIPFDTLEVWNTYQKGISSLEFNFNIPSNLKRRFKIWKALIPRDLSNNRDRIRSPWAYFKLSKNYDTRVKTELHDLLVNYFS